MRQIAYRDTFRDIPSRYLEAKGYVSSNHYKPTTYDLSLHG